MVSVAADPRSGAAEQLQKAAGPTTYELRKLGKTIKQWHPRANPKGRDVWSDDVSEYMRTAIPIIPNYILEKCETHEVHVAVSANSGYR